VTALDVVFRYGIPPNAQVLRALDAVREVYGVRRIAFSEEDRTVRVEYDATRLSDPVIADLLSNAGLDLRERVALV
jgi:hypothetical protein